MQTLLLWFRNDLRVQDQILLTRAMQHHPQFLIPLYCFDERQFATTAFGFPKTGPFRTKFLGESVADLRRNLQALGSNLVVRQGMPEDVVTQIAQTYSVDLILYSQEATAEEIQVEQALSDRCESLGIPLQGIWQSTLYHPAALPCPVAEIPDLFTHFRKSVERNSGVSPCEPTPPSLPPLVPDLAIGSLPTLEELGGTDHPPDPRGVLNFQGGERAGLERLQSYFWERDCLKTYKETRNGLLGPDYSSKFSPWLALGCLSPRWIYQEVQRYEQQRVANESTYWLGFELLWRDFFRFTAVKYSDRLFYPSGLRNRNIPRRQNWELFEQWCCGQTGYPLVDASMRELQATGFMSNRSRQNVASFLVKDLKLDWRMGAEWFESLLIDYDVCSNWGNWNYVAGVGNDARSDRYFNIVKQSKTYDPQGNYLRHWLPELATIRGDKIHEPWTLSTQEQQQFGVIIGRDYGKPFSPSSPKA